MRVKVSDLILVRILRCGYGNLMSLAEASFGVLICD